MLYKQHNVEFQEMYTVKDTIIIKDIVFNSKRKANHKIVCKAAQKKKKIAILMSQLVKTPSTFQYFIYSISKFVKEEGKINQIILYADIIAGVRSWIE